MVSMFLLEELHCTYDTIFIVVLVHYTWILLHVLKFQALAANVDIPASKFVPTVAFQCGKPAMHKTAKGWVADKNTDCKKEKLDIFKYCKSVSISTLSIYSTYFLFFFFV